MSIKKKKGVILIEVNIFLMIILSICSASFKIFTSNIEKGKHLHSRENIKTISNLEYEFLQAFNKFISDNKQNYLNVKEEGKEKKTNFEVYTNSSYKNYSIVQNDRKFYITHKKSNSIKYIGIDENVKGELIYFNPNLYKTDYIIFKEVI